MATVLVIAPGTPPSLEGRNLLAAGLQIEVCSTPALAFQRAGERVYDLLVLAGLPVDDQVAVAGHFQQDRRWRLVPILYVSPESEPGIAIPSCYRPDLDSIARGGLESPAVQRRIQAMARDGAGSVEMVVAGNVELDPLRLRLRCHDREVALTEREAEVLAILLAQPNRTVRADEIIQRGWGVGADERYLQILRRHVSNIRRKLHGTPAARAVRTVRGTGYRFDVRIAS